MSVAAMVKKRQGDAYETAGGGSSTDSGEEQQLTNGHGHASGNNCCQHIKKSVDTARLRRQLKTTGLLYDCPQCQKLNVQQPIAAGEATTTGECEIDNALWLCLKCGTQLCGRSCNKHALQHHETPHSDLHALALNTRSFKIWCYACDAEISPNSRKNLLECVELVKRLAQKPPTAAAIAQVDTRPQAIADIEQKLKNTIEQLGAMMPSALPAVIPLPPPPPHATSPSPSTMTASNVPGMAKRISGTAAGAATTSIASAINNASSELERLPRVRGLTNLGNTCFFNAVMQCLAQTPFLLEVLKELAEPGEQFVLPGGTFNFKDKGDIELPMIKGTLSSWGNLTSSLAQALEELQSGGGVFTPSKLFDRLCSKCPQFTGGDQHDSHELLRQMLESVRSEDLKRYQRVILQNLGYKDQDINSVSEELRQKCKIYGNQAADRILRPEQVFRGFLVSTLTCQDCYNISSRHEYFLDMSLPVAVEKPQPPQRSGHRGSPDQSPRDQSELAASSSTPFYLHHPDAATATAEPSPTKSQLKKEKQRTRKCKRAARHQRTKQEQQLKLGLDETETGSSNAGHNGGGGGDGDGEGDAEVANGGGITTSDLLPGKRAWGEGQRADTMSLSATTSEHSDADVEDNLTEDGTTKCKGKFYTDSNGNAQPLGEKRDDVPEHLDKDSLEEDENDSGIATSPAPTASSTSNNNSSSNSNVNGNGTRSESSTTVGSLVSPGLSEKGASLIRQLSIGAIEQAAAQETAAAAAKPAPQRRVRTQSYSDWSTTIAPRYQCEVGECSVPSCLNNFTAVELMTGQNKVGCESCTRRINGPDPQAKSVNTNATKQLLVSSPPAVLILHLKRFQIWPRCTFRKLTRQVSYPNLLDIAAFCGSKVKNLPNIDRKQKKLLYALYGVVEHSGGLYGGHYTAYVKVRAKLTPDDKRWKFLPHGSKAELDQDDEQLKKLEELLAKEKARELRMDAMDDSDDLTNSSSNASTSDEGSVGSPATGDDEAAQSSTATANDEASNVQAPPGKWYYVSDSRVQEVSEETALKAQAYLLFYERIY
ncbi:CG4165 [Drosophila busckii]|uniref:ubiquitinyl hydrolase 1 n=1 Tax=Drosophila busckii TaxID=30019 RepID=A0A0M3QZ24_DROBS|nr:ubiquitin carboxyl-terminal hydrolase 45 [Drosophila busckii]XP_017850360.1 ubiquitin carboxyl-terminal hydrolase 45 [Drosophila busckii]ALC48683.1 CG4165 [Drosophila busckii]